jgi:hypothetical protein
LTRSIQHKVSAAAYITIFSEIEPDHAQIKRVAIFYSAAFVRELHGPQVDRIGQKRATHFPDVRLMGLLLLGIKSL